MSSLRHLSIALLYCSAAIGFSLAAVGQTVTRQGGEYPLLESIALRGDQNFPQIGVNSNGGYVVWQDNAVDGSGFGIGARYLDSTFSPGPFGSFRVNQQTVGDQVHPQVVTFPDGGAAFAWEGGPPGAHNIFLRFLTPARVFSTATDLRVNVYTNGTQSTPALGALPNGNIVVAWSSSGQDGSRQGVFARIVTRSGQFVTAPFQVNQYTNNNQRDPALAISTNGTFVLTWISELQSDFNSLDVYGRVYNSAGEALSNEFRISAITALCANPSVSFQSTGSFTVVWGQRATFDTNSWDIVARAVGVDGAPLADPFVVNTYRYGDQFVPKIETLGRSQLVVWTSLGEDGSMEGVFGRLLFDGVPIGDGFLVNTRTVSQQINPALASDGAGHLVAVWAGFTGVANGFDLFAQRYSVEQPLPPPGAPFVSSLWSSSLGVAWPSVSGFAVASYEIYMDGVTPPAAPTATVSDANNWIANGLLAKSTHTFRLAYVLQNGSRSDLSAPSSGTTWGEDRTGPEGVPDGLPDDWQAQYWGPKAALWPAGNVDSDGDGVSNAREFLAGTNPLDANSVLKMRFSWNRFGRLLNWNTQPGFVYQVQVSNDLTDWTNFGSARFAAGATDSVTVTGSGQAEYFRVLRVR